MASTKSNNSTCIQSIKLLGDFWVLRIIDALASKQMRYCELQRAVDDINPSTLANRLKRLENAGVVRRAECTVDKLSVTYELTIKGIKALGVVESINKFSTAV